MKKQMIETTWDDEIITNMQNMFRSYSCRGAEHILFPLDFVPKLKPKLHGTLPSPMYLGLKSNKIYRLEEIKLDGGLEYNSDIEIYRTPDIKKLDQIMKNKFKTNKNLKGLIENDSPCKTNYSKSPVKKISLRQFKIEEMKLEDNQLGNKSISCSPKKKSILNYMERKISSDEVFTFLKD